jgi:hypothetical protein
LPVIPTSGEKVSNGKSKGPKGSGEFEGFNILLVRLVILAVRRLLSVKMDSEVIEKRL